MRVAAADDCQLGRSTRHSLMGEERWIDRRARSGDFLSLFPLFIFWGFFLLLITNATHSSSSHLSLSLSLILSCLAVGASAYVLFLLLHTTTTTTLHRKESGEERFAAEEVLVVLGRRRRRRRRWLLSRNSRARK